MTVLALQGYLALAHDFANLLETLFLPYCLLGAFAIHMATRPGRKEVAAILALAGVTAVLFLAVRKPPLTSLVTLGAFPGLASLTVLAVQILRLDSERRAAKVATLLAGSVFGFSAIYMQVVLQLTTRFQPATYDLHLYAVEQGYGLPILVWTAHWLGRAPLLSRLCGLVYESLPLAISLLYAYGRSGTRPLPIRVLPAFVGGGAAAYLLYNFVPACGPAYAFGAAFPDDLPPTAGIHLLPIADAVRNAIPSMHFGCALLIFWNTRGLGRWVRAVALAYLALTGLATLGFGEHYVIDLVAAFPYALLIQAVCARPPFRSRPEWKQAAAVGLTLTFALLAAVRFATGLFASVAFTWTASLLVLALCALARHRMNQGDPLRRVDQPHFDGVLPALQPEPVNVDAGRPARARSA